jgi:hypothetical protein
MSGSQRGVRREPNRLKIVKALERALTTFAMQAPNDPPKRRSKSRVFLQVEFGAMISYARHKRESRSEELFP